MGRIHPNPQWTARVSFLAMLLSVRRDAVDMEYLRIKEDIPEEKIADWRFIKEISSR
jgi:hypothetical protein